jgi:curved DNA-binding protein
MDFKDYYAELGVPQTATADEIKRAYRKLARKYHPDVSKEPGAEARFKEVAEAHEALIDPERRAAYDHVLERRASGQPFEQPAAWEGREDAEFSQFFEAMFGRGRGRAGPVTRQGDDHHAQLAIDLRDAYHGATRTVSLQGRQLEIHIPKAVRAGQQLRLSGQGGRGHGGAPAGDLYLEIQFLPDPVYRIDGRDLLFDLPVAPWEAALGAEVTAPTPEGAVQLSVPAGSVAGRKLRLKGRGLPGRPPGDLYAVLAVALPPAQSEPARQAWAALAAAFPDFDPRGTPQAWR